MKKSNIAIIIVCAAVLLLSGIFSVKYLSDKNAATEDVNNTTTYESVKKQKAKSMPNAVRIIEGKDFSLFADSAEEDEAGEDSYNYLSSSVFGRVFIKTKAFSASGKSFSQSEEQAFSAFLSKLKNDKKQTFLELDLSNENLDYEAIKRLESVDGIVLSGTKNFTTQQLLIYSETAKEFFEEKKIFLEIPFGFNDFEKLKFGEKKPDSFLIVMNGKTKSENEAFLEKADEFCTKNGIRICAGIRADEAGKRKSAATPLENTVLSENFSSVKSRLFLNLGDVQNDTQNCFSAVKEYLSVGIDKTLAFASFSVDGYSKGDMVVTSEHKISLILRGSNLFPFFLDGEEIEPSNDGTVTVDLSLKNGKNTFLFSQCSKEIKYCVTVDFKDEVIREIKPASVIYASSGKKLKLTVTAAAGADVEIKAGTVRIEPKKTTKEKEGYCDYIFDFSAPKSKIEIESLGKLIVTASYKDKTYTKEGPSVIYAEGGEVEVSTPIGESTTKKHNRVTIGNNVGTSQEETQVSENGNAFSQSTTAQPYTGNQMCVVTSDYADTWPPATNDDSFVPYYTPLVKGTIDYVTGQSQLYDSEEGITRDFYSLASGRRVLTKDVRLVSYVNQGENRISVASCNENNGDLEVKLSMNWEVPYSFSFGPQAYYSANSKKYNINSFTARYIQFTFYYTSSASGSVDTSKSNIVSAASWSADSTQNTVSLTLELKGEGRYYGYSITRDNSGKLVLTLKGKPKSLSGTVVVLDPGHGGSDVGATGLSGSAYESRMNFALAVATKNELEKRGARVLMTRTGDNDITLEERKTYARRNNAELFVSIHCNASVNTSKYGTSVYYYRPFSQPLANAIYEKMKSLFQNDFYASNSERRSSCAIGTLYNPFSVTRLEECPSVLIETAFITNETECRLLLDSGNRDKIAAAISDGIESYLSR